MTKIHGYPAMKWNPETKEAHVFHRPEDVPEGYLDTHPDNVANVEAAKKSATVAAETPESKVAAEKRKSRAEYPAMKWHPETGEAKVFHKAEDVPDGYLDTHPSNLANVAAANQEASKKLNKAKTLPLSKDEIIAALVEGGIGYPKQASAKALYDLLTEKVKAALTEAGTSFDPEADTKTLLGLLTPPE